MGGGVGGGLSGVEVCHGLAHVEQQLEHARPWVAAVLPADPEALA